MSSHYRWLTSFPVTFFSLALLVSLDLHKLKKIIRVNQEDMDATVEAGVRPSTVLLCSGCVLSGHWANMLMDGWMFA